MRTLLGILISASVSCASGSEPAAPASAGAGTTEHRVLVPNVLPAAPERPFVDIGPVLVRSAQHAPAPNELLLTEGDRLGADAFILEGRSIEEVYPLGASSDHAKERRVAALVLASLLTGSVVLGAPDGTTRRTTSGFYRAIRYVDGDGDPVDVSTTDVAHRAREALAEASTLRAQYETALSMYLEGRIAADDFERIRRRLAGT